MDDKNSDIAILRLAEPLHSGESLSIATPFTLDIPASFSRLGHIGQSYQMTQWYPKPAVYDHKGWHPMPYLDQGEFYSEFGAFDVTLTLPKNYVVGATGVLQTESEEAFLQEKVEDTNAYFQGETLRFPGGSDFPESSDTMKTIRYTAERVHDFAWFADKRFRVQKSQVILNNGNEVDTWVMFTNREEQLWRDAIKYVDRSVKYYSERVGAYPYPHATAVQSALSAGAGMEYPMITVIGLSGTAEALDEVITHEVGHNWFYGILAFNERRHPWMDEGINSYYEGEYMATYYDENSDGGLPDFLKSDANSNLEIAAYRTFASRNSDQSPDTPSDEFTPINYFLGAYAKPAIAFNHLEEYLGPETFDQLMQGFYDKWQFKHPYPEDLQNYLETNSGEDLDWLFEGMLFSTQTLDYALTNVQRAGEDYFLTIKNKGEIAAPIAISAVRGDSTIIKTRWYTGFEGTKEISISTETCDRLVLDAQNETLELYRKNNMIRTSGVLKTQPLPRLKFLADVEDADRSTLYFAPVASWNDYDKFMLGLALYNRTILAKPLEFTLVPMYSFRSGDLQGLGNVQYNIFPESGFLERITIGVAGRTFNYNFDNHYKFFDRFYKLTPTIELEFAQKGNSPLTQTLSYRYVNVWQEFGVGENRDSLLFRTEENDYGVHEVQYRLERESALAPMDLTVTAHSGEGFTKFFATLNQDIAYPDPDKGLELHAFAGLFANFDGQEATNAILSFQSSGITGSGRFQRDYMFDEVLFARSASTGGSNFFARQLVQRDADLKTLSNVGSSTDWMVGFGARTTIPGPIPLRPYADFALVPDAFADNVNFIYSAGLALPLIPDILEIYAPIVESDLITDGAVYQSRDSFWSRLSFRINFSALNPFELIENIGL